eukprot:6610021-Prymnesium_polylepis.1
MIEKTRNSLVDFSAARVQPALRGTHQRRCQGVARTAAQQQGGGRGWSLGRDPEPVHPARCRA